MKNKLTNSPNLNLNVTKDDAETNDFLYCWEQFSTRPNKIIIHTTYLTKPFIEIFSKYISERNTISEFMPTEDEDFMINDQMFVKIEDKIFCSYFIIDKRKIGRAHV